MSNPVKNGYQDSLRLTFLSIVTGRSVGMYGWVWLLGSWLIGWLAGWLVSWLWGRGCSRGQVYKGNQYYDQTQGIWDRPSPQLSPLHTFFFLIPLTDPYSESELQNGPGSQDGGLTDAFCFLLQAFFIFSKCSIVNMYYPCNVCYIIK